MCPPIALDPRATFDYVLDDDKKVPEEERTVFVLRGLTVAEEARVADTMISSIPGQEELAFRSGTHQLTVLRSGLRSWRNFFAPGGDEVECDKTKSHPKHVTDDCLDRLSSSHRTELVGAILDRGSLTEEEGK